MPSIADYVGEIFKQPQRPPERLRFGPAMNDRGRGIQPRPFGRPMGWTPQEESQFQPWMRAQAASSGTNPNADDLRQAYNYREAFRGGMQRGADGHGQSRYKTPDHPNRFVFEGNQWRDTMQGVPTTPLEIIRQAFPWGRPINGAMPSIENKTPELKPGFDAMTHRG